MIHSIIAHYHLGRLLRLLLLVISVRTVMTVTRCPSEASCVMCRANRMAFVEKCEVVAQVQI